MKKRMGCKAEGEVQYRSNLMGCEDLDNPDNAVRPPFLRLD